MIYSYPDYYKKFRCIADKCPDTCCSDWQIVIDDESLENIGITQENTGGHFTGIYSGKKAYSDITGRANVHFCGMMDCATCISIWEKTAYARPVGNIQDIRKNLKI